ncbi:MAG: hypothetical protein WCT27_05585 [Patescibacteria group bacterium]
MRQTLEGTEISDRGPEVQSTPHSEQKEADLFLASFEALPDRVKETLGEEERRMLREINEKHNVTFEHSLGVATTVDAVWPVFADDLEREGVRYEDMIRSASLHDVGKVALPGCVLKSTLKDEQLTSIFMDFIRQQPDRATDLLRKKGRLSDKRTASDLSQDALTHMDHRDVLPLDFMYRDNPPAMAEIIQSGLDPQMSFMDALRFHEAKSGELIKQSNIPNHELVSVLAGVHHNYDARSEVNYQQDGQSKSLSVVAAEVLHLADVLKAMTTRDQYKPTVKADEALEQLAHMAEQGVFNRDVTQRFVQAIRGK